MIGTPLLGCAVDHIASPSYRYLDENQYDDFEPYFIARSTMSKDDIRSASPFYYQHTATNPDLTLRHHIAEPVPPMPI